MAFRNIAVFVDPSREGEARAAHAVRLALRHGAHLIGIFAAPSDWDGKPADSFVRGERAIARLIAEQKAKREAAAATAGKSFKAVSGREDVSFEFRIVQDGDGENGTSLNSLHSDLVIIGHPRPGGLPSNWSAESLLLHTGVPVLVLPDEWESSIGENVLVAWNASREARRAIKDALPFLVTAQSVTVLVVDPDRNLRHGEEPGADVALYLTRHGAKVEVKRLRSDGVPVADVILAEAARRNSDLIVLGAYSHARSAQFFFGGVTRSLLKSATFPLLIAH